MRIANLFFYCLVSATIFFMHANDLVIACELSELVQKATSEGWESVDLLTALEEIKPTLTESEQEQADELIIHLRKQLGVRAPRTGVPAEPTPAFANPLYNAPRDEYLRNLVVTGSLVAPNTSSGGGSSACPCPLSGDVTGQTNANTVSYVCGVPACNLTNAYSLVLTATSTDIPDTLVLRDNTGSFAATTITLTGQLSLQGAGGYAASLQADPTSNYTLLLPTSTGFSGYVLTTDGNNPAQLNWQPVSAASINLMGDVTGPSSANTVAFVGGQSAANVAAATVLANAATSADTPNTIVKRDASGNFSASTITANLDGNATTATSAESFTGNLAGDVTGPQSATVVDFVGGQSAASVAAATIEVDNATSSDLPNTLVLRDGSGNFAAGQISAANFVATNGTNQLTLGTGPTTVITAPLPAASRVYTIPDAGANANFVMTQGAQTINGVTTFNNTVQLANQHQLDFYDAANTNFVGIQAPSAMTGSYTFALPATAPTGPGQVLSTSSISTLTWATIGVAQTIYVETDGNDVTGNGSFSAPYATLKEHLLMPTLWQRQRILYK